MNQSSRGAAAAILPMLLAAMLLLPAAARADIPYEVAIDAGKDKDLAEMLNAASQLKELSERPPPTETALRRRIDADIERLHQVLRAEGYYAGKITPEIDLKIKPAKILITVEPGPRYTLASVTLLNPDSSPLAAVELEPKEIGIELGQPARSADVLAAEQQIQRHLAERGYPLAEIPNRKAVVDHASQTMSVSFYVDTGPNARFGEVQIAGTERLSDRYIRNRLSWDAGDEFDIRELEDTRKQLIRSELFNSVQIAPADRVDPAGRIPIQITVVERKPRSIGGTVSWSSSEGFGVEAFWEHRNLRGHAEKLGVTATLSEVLIGVSGNLRLPDAIRPKLDVVGAAAIEREKTEAFTTERITTSAGLERQFGSTLTGGLGLSLTLETEKEDGDKDTFTLIGTPVFLRYDNTDDVLDPSEGFRALATVTPYYALIAHNDAFLRSEATASTYLKLDEKARFILAGRGRLGTIWGAGREELPADVRFYAGGGGSIRGYGFQEVGPLDNDNDPQGGLSAIEFGGELRARVTDTIGLVPFLEGGNVYRDTLPELYRFKFRYGAGLGLRYYSAIGPLRLDVAVPLDRRETDDPFQLYISLGQAF